MTKSDSRSAQAAAGQLAADLPGIVPEQLALR